jgi:uracil phosphoribosyltransferase
MQTTSNLILLNSSLAGHLLSILRNKTSPINQFRFALERLSEMLVLETVKNFPTQTQTIHTPLEATECQILQTQLVVVPILRAGLSMLPSFMHFFPDVQIGFIGQKRDEETAKAYEYYRNYPDLKNKKVIIADPMLATGGSAVCTVQSILGLGVDLKDITLTCVIAAPEGVHNIHSRFPSLQIVIGALDRCLNEKKYILPGLGDAGDLWTGTASN